MFAVTPMHACMLDWHIVQFLSTSAFLCGEDKCACSGRNLVRCQVLNKFNCSMFSVFELQVNLNLVNLTLLVAKVGAIEILPHQ